MKIGIVTATYNRKDMLKNLIGSLACDAVGCGHEIIHYILDDGSDPPVSCEIENLDLVEYSVQLFRQSPNQGREGYWATTHNLFELAQGDGHDLIIHLDDDVTVCKDFFHIAVKAWENVRNPYAMLNLFLDNRIFSHFHGKPAQVIDGMCLIPSKLLDLIGWTVYPQMPGSSSTGVWRQLSCRLVNAHPQAFVHTLDQSLTYHHGTTAELSRLNKKDREIIPMKTLAFADEVPKKEEILDPIRGFYDDWRDGKKTNGRWILCVYEGIGNCIVPYFLYLALLRKNPNTDVYCRGAAKPFYDVIAKHYETVCLDSFEKSDYERVIQAQRNIHKEIESDHGKYDAICDEMKLYADQPGSTYREVTPLNWKALRVGNRKRMNAGLFDVIICAGSLDNNARWLRKRYRRWPEVVGILKDKGLSVACIGSPNDYIYGAEDRIGLPLLESFDRIASCKCFASNCTGPAHFAEAIGKEHVVVVTASDKEKNWKAKYNRFTHIVDMSCAKGPCQREDMNLWRSCLTWECCYGEPTLIAKEILDVVDSRD